MNDTATTGPAVDTGRLRELAPRSVLTDPEAIELAALVTALLARPIPDVTVNAGHTVRAVMPDASASPGVREAWWVACEDPERGQWVTWHAYGRDATGNDGLSYDAGHYFIDPDPKVNRRRALADLAVRAGLITAVAERIAHRVDYDTMRPYTREEREDRRMASRLRRWAAR